MATAGDGREESDGQKGGKHRYDNQSILYKDGLSGGRKLDAGRARAEWKERTASAHKL